MSGLMAERTEPQAGRMAGWGPSQLGAGAPHREAACQGCVTAHALGSARGALRRPHWTARGSVQSDQMWGTIREWPLRAHLGG